MNRWIQTLTCLGVLTTANSLFGWAAASSQPSTTVSASPEILSDFPMNADQQWFVKETYLIMKPYEDDNEYATRLRTEGALGTEVSFSMKLEKPDFDWYSGLRIGIGRYLANHDKWDVSFYTTYFYAEEKSSSSPDRANGTLLTPLWSPTFDGGATDGQVIWRLNFFNWDLSAGREFNMLNTVVVHPFIGLRAALIYKKYKASYSDRFVDLVNDRILEDSFKANDTYWGIGPRAGVDFEFNFKRAWSFLGNLSAAIFYGRFDVEEKTSVGITNFAISTHYRNLQQQYSVRANLDTALGIGWEKWFKRHRVRLAPSVLLEASCWFDTNQFFVSRASSSVPVTPNVPIPNFSNTRRQGNLILMGFSFNLQTDF